MSVSSLIVLAVLVASPVAGAADAPAAPKSVLLLYSESRVLPAVVRIDEGIRSRFAAAGAVIQDAMRGTLDRRLGIATRAGADGRLEVAVSDRGAGVPEDDLRRIFDAFYTTKPHGLGMGLSISRSLIEAHGGRLWAENNPEGGATFTFTLPPDGGEDGTKV